MRKLLCLLIFIFGLFLMVGNAQAGVIFKPVFHTGLVGYWDFQEGAGDTAYDKSGYDNDGDLTNMNDSDWVDGKIGQALDFDGSNEYVDCGSDTSLNMTTIMTVEVWTKRTGGYGTWETMVAKDDVDAPEYWFGFGDNDQPSLMLNPGDADDSDRYYVYGNTTITDSNWHHIAGVYDGTDVRVYVDGELDNTPEDHSDTIYNGDGTLNIGNTKRWSVYYNGIIDEVRIYNRALSAGEVERLYKLSQPTIVAPTREGLVGYWPFEEGTGTKAGDHSGQGNNSDLQNMEESDWVDGKLGTALDFDGSNDYVNCGNLGGGNGFTDITVVAWFKTATNTGWDYFVSKDSSGVNVGDASMFVYENKLYFCDQYHGDVCVNSPAEVIDNKWHQGVFVLSSVTGYELFLDGQSVDTDSTTGNTIWNNSTDVEIGNVLSGASDYDFPGQIDEVRIYDRALEANEIEALYKSGRAKINASQNDKITDGLVGLWSFNGPDIDGNEAYDRSGQGNHGTLSGDPTPTIGRIGQALEFDGSDNYVNAGDVSASLDLISATPPSFSISAWFYPRTPNDLSGIALTDGPSARLFIRTANRFGFQLKVGSTYNYPTTTCLNQWCHVVGTYNASNTELKIYINGAWKDTDTAADTDLSGESMWARIGYSQNYFNGKIDEVRVYNRALSEQEVKRLYNMGH